MIPYALSSENVLVSIRQVPPGLACNCRCPACKSPLIARKGKRNIHHFAHYRKPECSYALESSLHHLAKAVLQRVKTIVLPPVHIHRQQAPIDHARLFQFGGVRVEQSLLGMVPDLILETARKKILVEVAAHHPARKEKIWRLQQARLEAIEIDVLSMYLELAGQGKGTDIAAFTERIVHGIRHKKWLFNPRQHATELRLRNRADRKKVKHKIFGKTHQFLVNGCPLKKRFYRRGILEGRSYANALTDCFFCPHCFEIEYHKKHVGFRQIATHPEYVYCQQK